MILATCPNCENLITYSCRCATEVLLDAAKELARQIETAPAGDPPLFGPGWKPKDAPTTTESPNRRGGDKPESVVRPSVRQGQSLGPPTDAEVKTFLARLKRMSFKSGSKGFNKLTGQDRVDDGDDGRRKE